MTNRQIDLLRLLAEAVDHLLLHSTGSAELAQRDYAHRLARQIETASTVMDVECELREAHNARQSAPQAGQPSGGHVGADSGQTPRSALSGLGNGVSE